MQARPRQFDPAAKRYDSLNTLALLREAEQGDDPQAGVLLHGRFALPFACLILPLAGLPLVVSARHTGRSAGVVLAMLLCFAYWMISLAGTALAEQLVVPPEIAAWSANGAFAILGALLLRRIDIPVQGQRLSSPTRWLAWSVKNFRRLKKSLPTVSSGQNGSPIRGPINLLVPVVD